MKWTLSTFSNIKLFKEMKNLECSIHSLFFILFIEEMDQIHFNFHNFKNHHIWNSENCRVFIPLLIQLLQRESIGVYVFYFWMQKNTLSVFLKNRHQNAVLMSRNSFWSFFNMNTNYFSRNFILHHLEISGFWWKYRKPPI